MNKIAIFCHGVPNMDSNQPNADALMHAEKLANEGYQVKIYCIFNEIYQSDETQEYYKKFNEERSNIEINILNPKLDSFTKKLINRVKLKLYPNLIDNELISERDRMLNEFKPDLIINFFERAIELNRSVKIKKVNFLSIPLDRIELLRMKLQKITKINFHLINSIIFIIVYKIKIKHLVNDAKINFISCPQSYEIYKKLNIYNLKFFFPLNRKKPKNIGNKNFLLMIGNLKSTFVIDALEQLNNILVFELENLRKTFEFEIVIIGKFKEEKKKYKNLLNKDWIKFKGWVDDVDKYFIDSVALLVPSKHKLSVRTKILDAFSCGLPVITYEANNFDDNLFINNENIVCAANNDDLIIGLRNIFINKEFRKYISDNSFKKYFEKINVDKTIKQNIESIKNIL